jgi:hypothetical protein
MHNGFQRHFAATSEIIVKAVRVIFLLQLAGINLYISGAASD